MPDLGFIAAVAVIAIVTLVAVVPLMRQALRR
jgi:hypothetical protein